MKNSCWLLYEDTDYAKNRDFASFFIEEAEKRGLSVRLVLLSQLLLGLHENGRPFAQLSGEDVHPQFVFSRQRDGFISRHLETMGAQILNGSTVCELCNDKRKTLSFLHGLPMKESVFSPPLCTPPPKTTYPVVIKPACSHGGDRVSLVYNQTQWKSSVASIAPEPMLQQQPALDIGKDLRIYVVFNRIVAGVMRTAHNGFLSNFSRGGKAVLHTITSEEASLAQKVIQRFQDAKAPLCFAGIDMLYNDGIPLINEVEDVVGSRMLYQVSDMNIVGLFLDEVVRRFFPFHSKINMHNDSRPSNMI